MRKHLRALLAQLRIDLRHDTARGMLVRSAGATIVLKVGATLLAFVASMIYARALGPHDYGLYVYVIAWASLLTIPAGLGIPQYLVREAAKAQQSMFLLRHWADVRVFLAGLLAALLLACAVFLPNAAGARWLFVIAAPMPLLSNLTSIRSSLLQAHGWIVRSQWPLLLLAPAAMLGILSALWLWRGTLHSVELVAATVAVALLPLLVNAKQLNRVKDRQASTSATTPSIWSALPFMWLGGLYLLVNRTDLIMLGAMKGAHEAGVYAVAARAALLVSFFAAAINTTLAPRIAQLYHSGEHALLQRLINAAARRFLALTLPVALILIVTSKPLLNVFYGSAYAEGASALQILATAQFLVLAFGSVSTILNMTGHAHRSMVAVAQGATLNVILNAVLIPSYGSTGAAIATGTSLVLAQGLMWYQVRRRLNLRPSGLGL